MARNEAVIVMASQLPPGYTDLATTVNNGDRNDVSIIGFVTDFLPPAPTNGTDRQMKFRLKDNSSLPNGLEVKFFKKHDWEFPSISSIGDVVLLRHIKE